VSLYGFSSKEDLKLLFGPAKEISKDERKDQDVEHILEWHNVGAFLKAQHGEELLELLPGTLEEFEGKDACAQQFEITVGKETRKGTFSKLIASAYPATAHHKKEFVLLDHYANTPIKVNVSFTAGL
jgi:hypothetical protein